jgi:hypothetical protein
MRSTRTPCEADDGNALVEFVAVGVLLLVPCVYLILFLGQVQAATFAADSIARESARLLVTEPDEERARDRAGAAAALILSDHGVEQPAGDSVRISCSASPCRTPDATVDVGVELLVPAPLLGGGIAGSGPLGVTVSTEHRLVVDRFLGGAA